MPWFTLDFNKHVDHNTPSKVSLFNEMILILKCVLEPLKKIQENALYRMRHDGTTISLEKLLNDYFDVENYDPTNHDATKTVYIDDEDNADFLFIHQDPESDVVFLEDADGPDDLFLDNESEGALTLKFKIFIPDTYTFNESKLRDFIDSYRYIGTTYTIETYTL